MKKILCVTLLALMVVLNVSCSAFTSSPMGSSNEQLDLLTIDQITEGREPGKFDLVGRTSLPEGTQLTVTAVRRLTESSTDELSRQPSLYGILARRTASISEGRWQASISLWETTPEGYYNENWQRQETFIDVQPNSMVDFLLTVEPKEFSRSVADLPEILADSSRQLFQFTPDGEPYLQVSKKLPVAWPMDRKSFASQIDSVPQSPWEGRSALDSTNTAIKKISEIPFLEDDNLSIPLSHQMQ